MGKVDQMKSLQEVILHLAVQVKEKIKAITAIINANLKSPNYPEGLLQNNKESYESCMCMDLDRLHELLNSDLKNWQKYHMINEREVTQNFNALLTQ